VLLSQSGQTPFQRSPFFSKQLPDDWKIANISAIYKKGRKCDVANYRPISLTSVICKIFGSIIRDHIMDHFVRNKLYSDRQFGFIKGRSTVLQLLKALDNWTEQLENGGQIDVIYTDFEKAFNKVPHKRLIRKLHSHCINIEVIDWIDSFLKGRKQRVKINDIFSQWTPVDSSLRDLLSVLCYLLYT
jgi:hypothetical protein